MIYCGKHGTHYETGYCPDCVAEWEEGSKIDVID